MTYVDIVLWLTYLLIISAIGVTIWAVVRGWRMKERQSTALEVRHGDKTGYLTAGLLVVTLAITFLLGSSEPLPVNGKLYEDTFWLKATDMFIFTSIILITICSAVIVAMRFRR